MNRITVTIDTKSCEPLQAASGILAGRTAAAKAQKELNGVDVTILVLAYNRVSKTRRCIESILKNTKEINYELLLIDNGSTDDTLSYLESVPYEKKKVIRISRGLGTNFAFCMNSVADIGRYLAFVANDVVVTPNWLANMVACAESDPRIGIVCPVASHASNFQEVAQDFKDGQEMQEIAGVFNQPDPRKWQERLRLISYTMLLKKETLLAVGYPFFDCGFFHDFGDDDLTFRIRRAGYKAILAGDVWVHHDHDFRNLEDKDPIKFQESLEMGRNHFKEKYHGIDAWDDVNNFLFDIADRIHEPDGEQRPKVLGIDVRCGTPVLEIKNRLRMLGHTDAELSAFTGDCKYEMDLKTICEGLVICDREEFLREHFEESSFDYVILDRPVNRYHEPIRILKDLLWLVRRGGQIIFPLYNAYSYYEYLNIAGNRDIYNPEPVYNLSYELMEMILRKTCRIDYVTYRSFPLTEADQEYVRKLFESHSLCSGGEELLKRLMIESFWFLATKL